MFGESESESPRVGSPWDSFISAPLPASPEAKTRLSEALPKLVPEVEYGNVEYKLKLINPSPERFLRLVTQMKWRLLEGGGQAYYELGVADSGHLIGLPRKDLEQSLETLEMMAAEIGASVVIVKEIEVPSTLDGRGMSRALGILGDLDLGFETTTETTRSIIYYETQSTTTRTERPAFQSSPAILPASGPDVDTVFHSDFEIEIASVYKPRPHRSCPVVPMQTKYTKRGTPPKPKKPLHPGAEIDPAERAKEKRMKRDSRRDARRKALLMPEMGAVEGRNDHHTNKTTSDLEELRTGLEYLLDLHPDSRPEEIDDVDENTVTVEAPAPRLIVEALVVRKLALEEAFLDFSGFALV